jgi:hypothetical protein
MLVLRQINLEYVANDRSAGESRTQIPLWELRSRTLTPLWKRGRGDFWAERGENYVANFWLRMLDAPRNQHLTREKVSMSKFGEG